MSEVTREEFDQLKKAFDDYINVNKGIKGNKGDKKPRVLSEYNIFMKEEIARIKISNPDMKDNKIIFKLAVENWKKNKK